MSLASTNRPAIGRAGAKKDMTSECLTSHHHDREGEIGMSAHDEG